MSPASIQLPSRNNFNRKVILTSVVLFVFIFWFVFGDNSNNNNTSLRTSASENDWGLDVSSHQQSIHSQGGQDGSLDFIFRSIGTTNKFYVEFGFSNDKMEGGTGANTFNLYQKGWKGLLLDGAHENPEINLQKLWIKTLHDCARAAR